MGEPVREPAADAECEKPGAEAVGTAARGKSSSTHRKAGKSKKKSGKKGPSKKGKGNDGPEPANSSFKSPKGKSASALPDEENEFNLSDLEGIGGAQGNLGPDTPQFGRQKAMRGDVPGSRFSKR